MFFKAHLHKGLADGTVTVAFRRWQRPRARPGARHRTPVGVLAIDTVTVVTVADITERDANQAGLPSRTALLEELDAYGAGDLYRIDFHFAGRDPREDLREVDTLSDGDVADLTQRLARLDAGHGGPWTMTLLRLIGERPHTRAADLAASLARDTASFKADVRKLKELGLTPEPGRRIPALPKRPCAPRPLAR